MKKTFSERVYQATKQIPPGKAATYGQIARKANSLWPMANGKRIDARMVGWALHANKNPAVPCHRVVNRDGRLAPNFGPGGSTEQRKRLLKERVRFKDEKHVDLSKCKYKNLNIKITI